MEKKLPKVLQHIEWSDPEKKGMHRLIIKDRTPPRESPNSQSEQPVQVSDTDSIINNNTTAFPPASPPVFPPGTATLNYNIYEQQALAAIEVNKQFLLQKNKSIIKIEEQRALNDEKIRFRRMHTQEESALATNLINSDSLASTNIDLTSFFREFINTYLVFKDSSDRKAYHIWDKIKYHHIKINRTELMDRYLNYIDEYYPNQLNIDKVIKNFRHCLRLIPPKEKCSLKELPPNSVMFKNGILNVYSFNFNYNSSREYYSEFCIDFDYKEAIDEPLYFDKLLHDISDNNADIESLIYEQIGATICQNTPIKKIFLYQGCKDAGKTRLAYITGKLFSNEDSIFLKSIAELCDENFPQKYLPFRFVHVLELSERTLGNNVVSSLKALADGYSYPFKIFLSTNHAITTGQNGNIDPALANRLSVVPFTHAMNNIDEDVRNFEAKHLKSERLPIIIKSLKAFNKVLHNKTVFTSDQKLNIYIDNPNKLEKPTPDFSSIPSSPQYKNDIEPAQTITEIMRSTFEVIDEPNPLITPTKIMEIVNYIAQDNLIKTPGWAGRNLKKIFPDKKIKRNRDSKSDGSCYYNLKLKDNSMNYHIHHSQ